MNTNRNNNNRRRGRGNNRGPGGGNGPQGNRIDSRARGNAPQMLEKYRKLAHDASMNDDRVQTEYYLQFADHYFRVIADSRSPKDEARARRDFDRDLSDDEDQEDEFEETGQSQNGQSQTGQSQTGQSQGGQSQPSSMQTNQDQANRAPANQGQERPSRERPQRQPRSRNDEDAVPAEEGLRGIEGEEEAAEDANPFVRDTRTRRPRTRSRGNAAVEQESGSQGGGVDPAVLPPSISRSEPEAADEQPARPRPTRTRTRRPRPADNGDAETLEAVS